MKIGDIVKLLRHDDWHNHLGVVSYIWHTEFGRTFYLIQFHNHICALDQSEVVLA